MFTLQNTENPSAGEILGCILRSIIRDSRDYTYIITGSNVTGKTTMCGTLREYGFNAYEISEYIYDLVIYTDRKNHVRIDDLNKMVLIVLNRPLERIFWK